MCDNKLVNWDNMYEFLETHRFPELTMVVIFVSTLLDYADQLFCQNIV